MEKDDVNTSLSERIDRRRRAIEKDVLRLEKIDLDMAKRIKEQCNVLGDIVGELVESERVAARAQKQCRNR